MSSIYPLPSMDAARVRLRHLEKLIRGVDARLKLAQPSGVAGLEAERERLSSDFDALYAAVALLGEGLRNLSRCSCGKVSHTYERYALRHMKALRLIDNQGHRQLNVYVCEDGQRPVFHVGHLGGPDKVSRR